MTPCTICATPCPGTDDDDAACCLACYDANLAGAELKPRPPRLRELPRLVRAWGLPGDEDGRDVWDEHGN